jgi:hypothetical protein
MHFYSGYRYDRNGTRERRELVKSVHDLTPTVAVVAVPHHELFLQQDTYSTVPVQNFARNAQMLEFPIPRYFLKSTPPASTAD